MSKLPLSFYTREDVVQISQDLLGKLLVTNFDGQRTSGIIVETEAYRGPDDRACHAYNNRRTKRTEVMFQTGGRAYVYLIYGLHHLFNVVTGQRDMPHAILVRGLEPVEGIDTMLKRRKFTTLKPQLTAGPGTLSKALGIRKEHTNFSLLGNTIWIEDRGSQVPKENVLASPRVNVDYAGAAALLPWRFRIKGNRWVSKAK